MASTYLTNSFSSPTNNKKWTWSAWVKRSKKGSGQPLFYADDGSANYVTYIRFRDTDQLDFSNQWAGSNDSVLLTNRKFRDTNCWYHIQAVLDTANSTAADRQILYVNGERETSFATETTGTLNRGSTINDGYQHRIGRGNNSFGSDYFDGLMSHVHFSDGQALAPTVFGSTDSTTGEWKINTNPSFTLGTNGFTILKDGNTVTDQSSNSNDWTVAGGSLTNTEDCPSNVFATLNPLTRMASVMTFSHNNNTITTDSSSTFVTATSTLAMSSGKYYFEMKRIAERGLIGITNVETTKLNLTGQYYPGDTDNTNDYGYYSDDGKVYNNGNPSGTGATWGNNDIVGCAVDLDNRKIYWHKNGTYINSGNPSAGSGGQTIPSDLTYYFAVSGYTSTTFQCNFGNGLFGTTAISSEGSNASGHGKFEYDVPTGYTALCTKGLNE